MDQCYKAHGTKPDAHFVCYRRIGNLHCAAIRLSHDSHRAAVYGDSSQPGCYYADRPDRTPLTAPASPSKLMRLVPAWLTYQSLLEHRDPSAPTRWPPTRAFAARGQSPHGKAVSMRCATRFTCTISHSAALLRKLMTTTTTSQCNDRTT